MPATRLMPTDESADLIDLTRTTFFDCNTVRALLESVAPLRGDRDSVTRSEWPASV